MHFDGAAHPMLRRYTKALWVVLGHRDLYTRIHSERVLALCESMGVRVGLSEPELDILRISAAIHDVGKIGIPDQILLKPGLLDDVESLAMRKHSELGASMVLAIEIEGARDVARIIRHHHENFDGDGYPDQLSGERIPVCSRMIRIADSYDAMALARAYHPARAHRDIMEILLSETAWKHDPTLMRTFQEIVEHSEYRSAAG